MQSDGAGALLFAGQDGTIQTAYNDLWRFDGTDWTLQVPTGASPPVRSRFAACWDPIRQRYVVFGGDGQYSTGGSLGDTWEWDPATPTWTQMLPATSPSPRIHSRMAYDLLNARVLMFGGRGAVGSETWSWDGTDWTLLTPTTVPPAREQPNMDTNWSTLQIVMFGGSTGAASGVLGDTWIWDGTDWSQVVTATTPGSGGLRNGKMSHDQLRDRMVVFGGVRSIGGFSNSAWEFDGVDWTERVPAPTPAGRAGPGFCYVPTLATNVLFGGYNGAFFADTWTYQTNAVATSTTSGAGCPSSVGVPTLNAQPLPWLGETVGWTVGNLPPGAIPLLVLGLANPVVNLGIIGFPNCDLRVSLDVLSVAIAGPQLAIPVDVTLLGLQIHSQGVAFTPLPSGFDLALTESLTLTIGSR